MKEKLRVIAGRALIWLKEFFAPSTFIPKVGMILGVYMFVSLLNTSSYDEPPGLHGMCCVCAVFIFYLSAAEWIAARKRLRSRRTSVTKDQQ